MVALIIIGVIVLICFAIGSIPIGADINYAGGKLTVSAKVFRLLLQIYPRKPAEKKEAKPEEEKKPEPEKKTSKPRKKKKKKPIELRIDGDEIVELLKKVLKGLGKVTGSINVDRFLLHYVAAGKDPYSTARTFGFVNATLCALAPVCAERFTCRDLDVRTDVDFNSEKMQLDAGIAVVLRIGSIFAMLFTILFGALGILIRNKAHWFYLKHFDKEEYEFQINNPGPVTQMILSVLQKEEPAEEAEKTPSGDTEEAAKEPQEEQARELPLKTQDENAAEEPGQRDENVQGPEEPRTGPEQPDQIGQNQISDKQ